MTESKVDLLIDAWRKSPIDRHYSLSERRLWDKQEEVLWALRANKRVAVKSGNTVGKSFIAADVVFDWLSTHAPARVVTTAPTFSQVEGILWKEIRRTYFECRSMIGGEINQTELKLRDDWFAEGISTNDVGRFQGRHNEHLLVILDEASGVLPEIWETVEALHPEAILAIGNPLDASGPFFDCFNSSLWHKITISCEDAVAWQVKNGRIPGLVTAEWIEEQKQIHGAKSPWYQIHVLGEFPLESPDSLISREWVDNCRKIEFDDVEEDADKVISTDVATKHGDNESVHTYRYGNTVAEMHGHLRDTITDTANRSALLYSQKMAIGVAVDCDGVGEGMSDILQDRKIPVLEFHGGSTQKAMDSVKFRNLRSQFYYVLAKKLEKGLISLKLIPDREFEILKNQLCSIKLRPPDGLGRIQVETKEDMQARGVKSPDYADSLMMSEFAIYTAHVANARPYSYR